jgi:flagellin-like protein
MEKKGVSPVIATILLIALVVAMGVLVFMWLDEFIEEPIEKFDRDIKLSCEDIEWTATYSSNTLYISNIGTVPIFGATIKLITDAGYEEKNLGSELANNWPNLGLNKGGIFSEEILFEDTNEIMIFPILLGSSDEESKTFECEKEFGIRIII